MENTMILLIVTLFFLLFAVLFMVIVITNQTAHRPLLQNFSDDFEYVIYRVNLSAEEIYAKLEKHDAQEVFMEYSYDAIARKICLKWLRYGSTTTYTVKIFEHPDVCILMLQYVEGMRIPKYAGNATHAILEDLNLFWKCIAEATPIPFYSDKTYYSPW